MDGNFAIVSFLTNADLSGSFRIMSIWTTATHGNTAKTRAGPPLPPEILIGITKSVLPRGGSAAIS